MKPKYVTSLGKSLTDHCIRQLLQWLQTNKYCLVSTLVAGLVAHLFFLSHKIPSLDDPLLTYGYDVSSGRWGIWILKQLVPPASMPWFNGMVTILLTAVTTTLTAQMLDIKRPLTQILLSSVIVKAMRLPNSAEV